MSTTRKRSDRYYADCNGPRILPFDTDETGWFNPIHARDVYHALQEWDRTTYVKAGQLKRETGLPKSVVAGCMALIARETDVLEAYAPERPRNSVYKLTRGGRGE